jgi:hypothetical protein
MIMARFSNELLSNWAGGGFVEGNAVQTIADLAEELLERRAKQETNSPGAELRYPIDDMRAVRGSLRLAICDWHDYPEWRQSIAPALARIAEAAERFGIEPNWLEDTQVN